MELNIVGNIPSDAKKRLSTLFSTPIFSVPFDRGFGLDMSFLDYPIDIARIKMLQSCIEQAKKYEPEYKIEDIHLELIEEGKFKAKVEIKYAT